MRRFGAVAIVLLGLFSLLQSIGFLSYAGSVLIGGGLFGGPQMAALVGVALLPFASYVFAGTFLIRNRQMLADRFIEESPLELNTDEGSLLRLGLLIVGISLVVHAIPSVIAALSSGIIWSALSRVLPESILPGPTYNPLNTLVNLVGPTVELGLGLLLVGRSRQLAGRLWHGTQNELEAEPDD